MGALFCGLLGCGASEDAGHPSDPVEVGGAAGRGAAGSAGGGAGAAGEAGAAGDAGAAGSTTAHEMGDKNRVRFAVIGEYGSAGPAEQSVADLIKPWEVDLIVTLGGNNLSYGAAKTIDPNIGQFFSTYIAPYQGTYAPGAGDNRFFPALGEQDWAPGNCDTFLSYFTLPGKERYYDFVRGNVHFFALDSAEAEPDGVAVDSAQALWLKGALAGSTEAFNVVYFQRPPFSSGDKGSTPVMQWPFAAWGASVVLSARDRSYERLTIDEIPYLVNGIGGAALTPVKAPLEFSKVRYNVGHGALLAESDTENLTIVAWNADKVMIDQVSVPARTKQ